MAALIITLLVLMFFSNSFAIAVNPSSLQAFCRTGSSTVSSMSPSSLKSTYTLNSSASKSSSKSSTFSTSSSQNPASKSSSKVSSTSTSAKQIDSPTTTTLRDPQVYVSSLKSTTSSTLSSTSKSSPSVTSTTLSKSTISSKFSSTSSTTKSTPSSTLGAYSLKSSYDYTNWFTSFAYQDLPDPTNGFVDYVSLTTAQNLGLTKIIKNQVYMGVDNTSILSSTSTGRKSIWVESNDAFLHGLLIGDFAHMPSSVCGAWPAFWTIRNGDGSYGEIDILEGFSDITQAYTTLHTANGTCIFDPPSTAQLGTSNQGNTDCTSDVGCSVIGPANSYGTPFNENGGGVYAMEWTSTAIKIFFFARNSIPADITAGKPNPTGWGLPAANFDTKYGDCNIDANFPPQTIYFDTTFCGGEAGGQAWTDWTDCSAKTGYSTCEAYVAANPAAYTNAYWLINSVKVYQKGI